MKLNWNYERGVGVSNQKPSLGVRDIFWKNTFTLAEIYFAIL